MLDVEQKELSFMSGGNAKWHRHSGNFSLNILLSYNPATACLGIHPELKTDPHTNLHTDVYGSFIHNCQNLDATNMTFSR